MSISTYAPREEYVGTGAVTEYTFDFKIASSSHLRVVQATDLDVETFDVKGDDLTYFTVDFDAVAGGGTVTLLTALPLNHHIYLILDNDEPLQESEFKNKSDFSLSRFEAALDVQAGAIQRLTYLAARTAKASELIDNTGAAAFDWSIPSPVGQAGKTLAVNATEDGFEWV